MSTSVTSAGLKAAADKCILASRPLVETIRLFSTNISVEPASRYSGVAVEILSATASEFGANNGYTKGGNAIKPATVSLNKHYKSGTVIGDKDALENELAPVWANIAPFSAKAVAKQVITDVMGLLTYGNAASQITKNPTTLADFADIRASVVAANLDPADCVLVLIPSVYAKLLAVVPANVLGDASAIKMARLGEFLGFKAVIEAPNASTADAAGSTNGIGFVVPTGAIAIASRVLYPVRDGGNLVEFGTVSDDETGFGYGMRVVVDADQGTCTWNVDALYGVALTYSADGATNAPRYLQIKSA